MLGSFRANSRQNVASVSRQDKVLLEEFLRGNRSSSRALQKWAIPGDIGGGDLRPEIHRLSVRNA
jgi:hypothetical protein